LGLQLGPHLRSETIARHRAVREASLYHGRDFSFSISEKLLASNPHEVRFLTAGSGSVQQDLAGDGGDEDPNHSGDDNVQCIPRDTITRSVSQLFAALALSKL